jgi:hypothetical protein
MRVRLLSMAQARHAAATSSADTSSTGTPTAFHDRTTAPVAMDIIPMAIRVSKLSRKNDQASIAVKTPSRFSMSDD